MMYSSIEDAKKKVVKDKIPVAKRSNKPAAFEKQSKGQYNKLGGSKYETLKKVKGSKKSK